jgi:hypothetical protein
MSRFYREPVNSAFPVGWAVKTIRLELRRINTSALESVLSELVFGRIECQYLHFLRMERH